MGIPYSREINAAFEQVTPLVAAGFKVLRTTKNISIILAIIQVLTVLFLGMILGALVVLIYVVNPDLEVCSNLDHHQRPGAMSASICSRCSAIVSKTGDCAMQNFRMY